LKHFGLVHEPVRGKSAQAILIELIWQDSGPANHENRCRYRNMQLGGGEDQKQTRATAAKPGPFRS
jgi:hypothetical protein